MDKLSPDDPMLEMRQTLHDILLENTALRQRVEALERALKANMDWIGAPPRDRHSFDSVREQAWELGRKVLAAAQEVEGHEDV